MPATIVKGSVPMEMKKVSISAKRQISIPQKFFTMLVFDTGAECMVRGNKLAYTVEYQEDKVIVVIMVGTRENFYDQLRQYIRKW